MNLQGKTVILTGAARIGQKVAEDLKNKGANLVITYLNSPEEASLGFGIKADVSKKEDVENSWNKNMEVIAKSSFLFGKIAGDEMLKNEGDLKGKMIFFADWSVLTRPYKDYLTYNVAKSAVVGLTKSLAKEL